MGKVPETPEQTEARKAKAREATRRYRAKYGDAVKPDYRSNEYREWNRKRMAEYRNGPAKDRLNSGSRKRQEEKRRADGIQPRKPGMSRDERLARSRDAYVKNAEKRRTYRVEYGRKNRDKERAYGKSYRAKNLQKVRDYVRKYSKKRWASLDEDGRKEWREYNKKRYAANIDLSRDKQRHKGHKRRASVFGVGGEYDQEDVSELLMLQGGKCAAISCRKKLILRGKGRYHVDHVIPISKGGPNTKDNLCLLCPQCNFSKGAKDPDEWARQKGVLFF